MAGGRPSGFTQEYANEICRRLSEGESLRAICRDDAMPSKTAVLGWLADHPGFAAQYAHARDMQADHYVEETLEIADLATSEDYQVARLRVDARKWFASKLAPKKYGDRVHTELTGKDGGPIQSEVTDPVETARRVALLLQKGAGEAKG